MPWKKHLASLLFFLILFELALRFTGIFQVYTEKMGGKYKSYWGYEHKGHYKLLPRNERILVHQKEFILDYQSNRFGMRNPEINSEPPDSTIRVLCLGDSFTEGDGAPYGFSFPRQLESILNKENSPQKYQVVNAGRSGSDIIYSEKLFVENAYKLQPKLVLVITNDSDIDDIIKRGGIERFKDDRTTKYKPAPWFEKYYKKSHVIRFIVHIIFQKTPLLLSSKSEKKEIKRANQIITESMERMKLFCNERNIDLRFIIHPYPAYAKNSNKSELNFKLQIDTESNIELQSLIYNLTPTLLDTLKALPYESFAWPINGHFNANGYKIMSEQIFDNLKNDTVLEF